MSPFILIIDEENKFELAIRRAFDSYPVKIRQVQTRQEALLIDEEIQIMLIASNLNTEDPYVLAADLMNYYPSAALYFLADSDYDPQKASDCGALGYFKTSVSPNELKDSLAVFLPFEATNNTTIVPVSHLNFDEDFDFGAENHINEQLEQLLKVQLLTNVNLRKVIRRVVHEIVQELSKSDTE